MPFSSGSPCFYIVWECILGTASAVHVTVTDGHKIALEVEAKKGGTDESTYCCMVLNDNSHLRVALLISDVINRLMLALSPAFVFICDHR